MTDSYKCAGCDKRFSRSGHYIQHLEKTSKPRCKVVYETVKSSIRHSRFMPRRDPRHIQSSKLPHSQLPQTQEDQPAHFQGDFFGDDYSTEDFPGFDVGREEGDHDVGEDYDEDGEEVYGDKDEDDEDGQEDDNLAPELEPTFERSRQPFCVPEGGSSEPESMDIDATIPVSQKIPPLRDLLAHKEGVYVTSFGGQAGAPVQSSQQTTHVFHNPKDGFEDYERKLKVPGGSPHHPFNSYLDWSVAHWAKMRGPSSTAFSDLLAIDGVVEALDLSYSSSAELNEIIDKEIPSQRPSFVRREVVIAGEAFDIYHRPVMSCIESLFGAPEHAPYLCVTPERHYADPDKTKRLYHDMNTGKWWWSTQKALEQEKPGATVVPVILSSDKTQVTLFRNKTAYPVYLTIGNLPKEIRRKPSRQGQILLAYLPTSQLKHITNKAARRRATANLFHACMTCLLSPLKEAGAHGTVMSSGDGVRRRCHPILATYVGDYPEQVLVTCAYYGDCPLCEAQKKDLGTYPCTSAYRDFASAVNAAKLVGTSGWAQACLDTNIKPVQHPFWEDLPYTDIFRSVTPDLLHQLYQGVMKHLIQWITAIVGADEIDARVRRLPANHSIRHFHKGITSLSRVSGAEHKQMCTFLLNLLIDAPNISPSQSKRVLSATRALLDFLYMANYPIHSDDSLQELEASLATFHENKEVFIELGVRQNFNLPKLHSLCHYTRAIKLYGSCDNYNTETTERLHIDFAKDAYRASNRKDEYSQMTKWLERREKMVHHANYLEWKRAQAVSPQSTPPSDPMASLNVGARYNIPGSQRTLSDVKCALTMHVARFPTVKAVSFDKLGEITCTGGYGATQFEYALKEFIARFRGLSNRREIEEMTAFLSLPFRSVPVWHRVKFRNEELFGKETLDVVSAHPRRFNSRGQVTQISHFDAALIQPDHAGSGAFTSSSSSFLEGLQIGRVRVIFSFPDSKSAQRHISSIFAPGTILPSQLA
ncbi:hypothetical protein V5O48_013420, partial [Marasmius crinis-equi]